MTLLPGVIFVLIIAFLAITVALNVRLVGYPFRFRLRSLLLSLLRTFLIRTRLTVSCIDLYLLQSVVVIVLVRNVSLSFSVSSTIVSVTASLFQLQLKDPIVDLDGKFREILEVRQPVVPKGDLLANLVLESSVELGCQRIVVPIQFSSQDLELGAVLCDRSALSQRANVTIRFQSFVAIVEHLLHFVE